MESLACAIAPAASYNKEPTASSTMNDVVVAARPVAIAQSLLVPPPPHSSLRRSLQPGPHRPGWRARHLGRIAGKPSSFLRHPCIPNGSWQMTQELTDHPPVDGSSGDSGVALVNQYASVVGEVCQGQTDAHDSLKRKYSVYITDGRHGTQGIGVVIVIDLYKRSDVEDTDSIFDNLGRCVHRGG